MMMWWFITTKNNNSVTATLKPTIANLFGIIYSMWRQLLLYHKFLSCLWCLLIYQIYVYTFIADKTKHAAKAIANGKVKAEANGQHKVKGQLEDAELQPLKDEKEEIVVTLHDVTMSLKAGTLLGVCGAVGSGKTSLLQAILGMVSI